MALVSVTPTQIVAVQHKARLDIMIGQRPVQLTDIDAVCVEFKPDKGTMTTIVSTAVVLRATVRIEDITSYAVKAQNSVNEGFSMVADSSVQQGLSPCAD